MTEKRRSAEQRTEDNTRYHDRRVAAGIVRMTVMVPADRVPDLRAVLLQWREEAKMLLQSDFPTADQILQIHSVCRVLDLPLPLPAFRTQATAEEWLLAHHPRLGELYAKRPRTRTRY